MVINFFKFYLMSLPIIIVFLFIFFAYLNQKGILKKLSREHKDINIIYGSLLWPATLTILAAKLILWDTPNRIFARILKEPEVKPPTEVKSLNGAELDALLTKEHEEKMGWRNKN